MQPVPPGHVRITWTDTLTVPVSALTGARLDPACITAGEVENGSDLCAWLEDREDTEDADAEYQNVRSREIIRLDWPPGEEPHPPDIRAHHLTDATQEHTGADHDQAATIAARLWNETTDEEPVSSSAWIITRDHLDGGNANGVYGPRDITSGQFTRLHAGDGMPFRLYDADGVLCFDSRLLGDPATIDRFAPLDDFGRGWAECTTIRYRNPATGHWDEPQRPIPRNQPAPEHEMRTAMTENASAKSPDSVCEHHWLLTSPDHGPYATYGCQRCPATGKGYETILQYRLSSDELLAEARRALLESEQATGSDAGNHAARDLRSAFRALDSTLSKGDDLPAAWSHPAPPSRPTYAGSETADGEGDGWTVVGVWLADAPVPIGVIRGSHEVTGGAEDEFPEGLWATHVDADDAEAAAIQDMRNA